MEMPPSPETPVVTMILAAASIRSGGSKSPRGVRSERGQYGELGAPKASGGLKEPGQMSPHEDLGSLQTRCPGSHHPSGLDVDLSDQWRGVQASLPHLHQPPVLTSVLILLV